MEPLDPDCWSFLFSGLVVRTYCGLLASLQGIEILQQQHEEVVSEPINHPCST